MKSVTCFAIAAVAFVLTLQEPAGAAPAAAPAPLPADPQGTVATLPPASPHWIYVNDFVFPHMPDGQVLLVDGDAGRFLGLLSTGFGYGRIVPAKDGKVLFSPETYFSRGTRGTRTDIVTLYDPRHLTPIGEIPIPPKRSSNMPMMGDAELTDDGRFLLIYNFTPSQSITVVDTQTRKFVGEVETAGCALAYPTGPRSFFSICSDGALLRVTLDDTGHSKSSERTARMFDVAKDPATEKGVRVGNTWHFVTYAGMMYPIEIKPDGQLALGAKWSLLSPAEQSQQWRPGGLQQLAAHAGLNRLYSIMHRGGPETHKDPGKEVWVYDLARHTRIQKITLRSESGSIQVSRDAQPLLFSVFIGSTTLDVYDAVSGAWLRSVPEVGT
ncbi:MAG TPA: amine dehydrogenase large subunit, partial [Steroidobacteraceae bacterium]|nr:amine dehydrogenase large subunit [Steroidobacteraceae bacterium]